MQLTVPDPTYAAGSAELAAFRELNQTRGTYGVGLVAQNLLLDTASQNHANYLNNRLQAGDFNNIGHSEDATKPGFTGVLPGDRIAYAKYASSQVGEDLTSIEAADSAPTNPGVVSINTLMSGPYHRFSLLDPNREVGFSNGTTHLSGHTGTQNTLVTTFGVAQTAQGQLPSKTWVGVWPADQATGVLYSSTGENPNPIPTAGRCAGYPVSVQVRNGQTLNTSTFTLVEAATGTAVNVQLSTQATDVNPSYARANSAYIMPFLPLKLATKYTAHFVGSQQDGTAIDKTWSFTTRTDNALSIYNCSPSA